MMGQMLEVKVDKTGLDKLIKQNDAQMVSRAANSALSSVGYKMQQEIKRLGSTGVGQLGWKPLSGYTGRLSLTRTRGGQRRLLQRYKNEARNYYEKDGQRYTRMWTSTRRNPMGRLASAIRYHVDKSLKTVTTGFIKGRSAQLEVLARKQAEGYQVTISPRMRRMFWGLHLPLTAGKATLVVPPRPWVGRVWNMRKAEMLGFVREKFVANIERYKAEGK
jgi:hypothetical protein